MSNEILLKLIIASIIGSIVFISFVLLPLWLVAGWVYKKISYRRAARTFVASLRADADAREKYRRHQERAAALARKDDEFYQNLRRVLQ